MTNSHTRAVTKNKENKLQTKKPYQILTGRVIGHRDGFGFMQRDVSEPEGDDVFLPAHTLRHVLHGDTVRVQVIGIDPRGRLEGEVLEVLEHRTRSVVGRLLQEKGQWLVVPEDQRLKHDIYIDAKDTGAAVSGQVVVVTITQYSTDTSAAQGIVTELLGEVDDPGMEIEIAVRKFDVPHVFSEAALTLADYLPSTVQAVDLIDRVDLRDINLLTIDGEDARDFDDAVYCEPIGDQANQGWRLLVAIADVSHYVRNGNALDVDAQERTTSVYFPRRVIPMLPEKISNGLCSLMPKVDRLCMVADMVISKEGSIDAYQFYPAVMHSAARLTYNQVWEALSESKVSKKNSNPAYAVLPELHHLYAVFQAFLSTRKQRGAIEFETTETYFISNEAGKIERIEARTRNDAHRLIEECMLAANVCAANMLTTHKQAALYRVHEGPTPPKLEALREYLKNLGLQLGGGDSPKATDYARLMQTINAREDAQTLQSIVLRSMQQAVYTPDNVGHFGLSYEAYAHFTSPIRRYPDLLVHIAIKAILAGYNYSPIQTAADPVISLHKKKKDVPQTAKLNTKNSLHTPLTPTEQKNHNAWTRLGILCSAYERRADEASRDVESWLKCQYMQQYMGDVFSGTITGVANFGLFVTLDGLYVEGTVHITELGAEYFQHIEATHELRGSKTGKRYTVGQTVHVQVARVDLEARRIELKLTQADIALKAGHLKIKPPLSSNAVQDSQSDQTKPSKRTKNIVKTAIKIAKKAVDLPTLNVGVATKKLKKLKN